MMNILKSHWIAITICLVYSLMATGTAIYFINSASNKSKASSLKMAEDLKTAQATLSKSNTEMESIKTQLDQEKNINSELKKTFAESTQELEDLRKSVASKKSKRPVADSANCPGSESVSLNKRLRKLNKLQAELDGRESELSERQNKLNRDMNALANERRKLFQEKSSYSWP